MRSGRIIAAVLALSMAVLPAKIQVRAETSGDISEDTAAAYEEMGSIVCEMINNCTEAAFEADVSGLGIEVDPGDPASYNQMFASLMDALSYTDYCAHWGGNNVAYYDYFPVIEDGMLKTIRISFFSEYLEEDGSVDKERIKEDIAKSTETYNNLLNLVRPEMTDLEKVLILHDGIIALTDYPDESDPVQMGVSYNDILTKHLGICISQAQLYHSLLTDCGITDYVLDGDEIGHAWNLMLLDGEWYHADVTWDNMVAYACTQFGDFNQDIYDIGSIEHQYFLKSDEEIIELGHPAWQELIPKIKEDTPESGPSGSFDDYVFSYNEDTDSSGNPGGFYSYSNSSFNYLGGKWYFLDRNENKICCSESLKRDDIQKFDAPCGEIMKYIFGSESRLYICTSEHIYSFNPEDGGAKAVLNASDFSDGSFFTEMNVCDRKLNVVAVDGEGSITKEYFLAELEKDDVIPDSAEDPEESAEETAAEETNIDETPDAQEDSKQSGPSEDGAAQNNIFIACGVVVLALVCFAAVVVIRYRRKKQ